MAEGKPAEPVRITGARQSRSEQIRGRQTRYVISMLIRTGCFVGAVLVDGVLRWVLVAAAIFLPYIAVVLANAGVQREPAPPPAFTPDRGQLGPGDSSRGP